MTALFRSLLIWWFFMGVTHGLGDEVEEQAVKRLLTLIDSSKAYIWIDVSNRELDPGKAGITRGLTDGRRLSKAAVDLIKVHLNSYPRFEESGYSEDLMNNLKFCDFFGVIRITPDTGEYYEIHFMFDNLANISTHNRVEKSKEIWRSRDFILADSERMLYEICRLMQEDVNR